MLYHIATVLKQYFSFFNVVHYITFRASVALLMSLIFSLIGCGIFIRLFGRCVVSHPRPFTPDTHKHKKDIPLMGGLVVLLVVFGTVLLWGNLSKPAVWFLLMTMFLFGAIGLIDDIKKIKTGHGISALTKISLQLVAALVVVIGWLWWSNPSTMVWFPFFKRIHPEFGVFFIAWAVFILIGTSNAVNLTDGLDGLAPISLIANFVTFSLICYMAGHVKISQYLAIPFAGSAELTVVGSALAGALIGFLWFNTYPAQIFLGDVGSLALGAGLAFMALVSKQELLLPISGGLFVAEIFSVILQVVSYKLRGKRIFKMAPLHHHYELLGWPEAKITIRFGIISFILCLIVLMMLKLR